MTWRQGVLYFFASIFCSVFSLVLKITFEKADVGIIDIL